MARLHVIIDVADEALSDGDDANEVARELVVREIDRPGAYDETDWWPVEVVDAEWRETRLRL